MFVCSTYVRSGASIIIQFVESENIYDYRERVKVHAKVLHYLNLLIVYAATY